MEPVGHRGEQCHGDRRPAGRAVDALLAGPGACDRGAERRLQRIDLHAVVLGSPHAEQERFGVAGLVVAHRQDHAGFGDPVVGWVFADHRIHEQVVDLLYPYLPRTLDRGEVLVAARAAVDVAREHGA